MENQIPESIDIGKLSDTYARAKIDAEIILKLCVGISQAGAENKYLKEKLAAYEKPAEPPKQEAQKGAQKVA